MDALLYNPARMAADDAPEKRAVRLVAGPADAGRRVDEVLARALGIGRRAATRLAREVRVNGRRSTKGARVAAGDELVVPSDAYAPPDGDAPLDLVATLADVLVLAKPAGLPSVALRGTAGESLAARIARRHPECAAVGRPGESGLVHRLDTGTSGLLLAARTRDAYAALRADFRAHRVEKEYLALASGRLEAAVRATAPIGQHRASKRRMRPVAGDRARRYAVQPAETAVEPVRLFADTTLIRVHLASLGHPLVNDPLYGTERRNALPGFLLHASALRWRDPATCAARDDRVPLPETWQRLLDALDP